VLDRKLVEMCRPALEDRKPVRLDMEINNTDRATGTILSHEISKRWEIAGLPDDTIWVKFTGSAGQSFGAWLANGVSMELCGDANDYVGKGLSGGKLIVYPPANAGFVPEDNIIIGNVALYGAIAGKAFFRGEAAERFCVRNSGVHVVVEGVGDHGCEYMTGGRAVILGNTGRNFAAGMSGGIAYVWDPEDRLPDRINSGMVGHSRELEDEDEETILALVGEHLEYTGSTVAQHVLETWEARRGEFYRVISPEFKRVLDQQRAESKEVVHG
jgi:glutamate synthase (NADPH/NADH) large chain